jgi:hypothetical protein
MPHCFYALVTGNNQANLAAVFALAQAGDRVVWLQTPTAKQLQWLRSSGQILDGRALQSYIEDLTPEEELSPSELARRIDALVCRTYRGAQAVFVLNGGQKFTALGFERAAAGIRPEPISLYADLQAATLLRLDAFGGSFRSISWGPAPITLDELLTARGNARSRRNPGIRIWPSPPKVGNPLAAFREQPALQSIVLRIYSTCTVRRQDPDDVSGGDEASQKLSKLVTFVRGDARSAQTWNSIVREHICNSRLARKLKSEEFLQNLKERLSKVEPPGGALFNAVAGFFQTQALYCLGDPRPLAITPDEEQLLLQDGWIGGALEGGQMRSSKLARSFGDAFEDAVACRLLEFLKDNPELAATVSEVWRNVEVCREGQEHKAGFAEYDVAILFDSGRLVHLECKAGVEMSQSRLYSRLAALKRTGGEGGDQVLCGPLFGTADDPRSEFRKLHEIKTRVEEFGFKFLEYDAGHAFENGMMKILERHRKARLAADAAAGWGQA